MRIAVFICFLLSLSGCQPDSSSSPIIEVDQEPEVRVYREVGGQALRAYVFRPEAIADPGPASAILLFHGGGWDTGAPEWTFNAARRFSSQGMVAVSVEYRLSTGVVTPIDALDDVCASFVWARDHAVELGLDPERVAGYGISAGGHLATSTATVGCTSEEASDVSSQPDALILWSPALDMGRDGWFDRMLQGRASAGDYSPIEHVRASTPPTLIVQGELDTLTPLAGAQAYCDLLLDFGVTCELNVYEGVGHLLTRNLAQQERDFEPDPEAVADGIEQYLRFLKELGFIINR